MPRVRQLVSRAGSRHTGVIVALLAIAFAAVLPAALRADDTVPDPPGWSVTATTATTNLVDGQVVNLNVKSRSNKAVDRVEVRQCRAGVTYSTPADINPNSGKCPFRPVSSSADDAIVRTSAGGFAALAQSPQGGSIPYRVGIGVVDWIDTSVPSMTCDPTHPCLLVVQLVVSGITSYWTTQVTFVDNDPLAACGKLADGILTTQGSDELSDTWAAWTRGYCSATTGGAPSRMAFAGEDNAVSAFAAGVVDIAYTSAGYDDTVGLTTLPADRRRAAVAVPIALNASVMAAGGGFHQLINGSPTGDKAPYPEGSLSLKSSEVAALLGGGILWVGRLDKPFINDILNRNPALHGAVFSPESLVLGPSFALSSVYYMTKYLSAVSPNDFIAPGETPALHGPSRSLAEAKPPYSPDRLTLYTGRPSLQKVMFPASLSIFEGPIWTVSDRATSAAIGMTPVAIQTASGSFVAPTRAAMLAAVSTMKPDSNGLLKPDPLAVAASATGTGVGAGATAAVQPYPLTYVEYALVPAEPLIDPDTCAAKSQSQAVLTGWLSYITGAGQQKLPPGMEALPQSLLDEAKAAIAKVGAAPVTGACAGKAGPVASAAAAPLPSGTISGGVPTIGGIPTLATGGRLGPSIPSPVVAPAGNSPTTRTDQTAVVVPAFAGRSLPDVADPAFALLAIVVITSLAVFITSQSLFGTPAAAGAGGAAGWGGPRWGPGALVALWAAVAVTGIGLVLYGLGPLLQQRDQQDLFKTFRTEIEHATFAKEGLGAAKINAAADQQPPEIGSPVAVVEIGALRTQAVTVEGAAPSQTSRGPGHVPGTAGIGQPGNSVLVARRNAYGATFRDIAKLRKGDAIVTTTTQGQSVYRVTSVTETAATKRLYGPSKQDQLTVLTSASRAPWNSSSAAVVVAKMEGLPFPPTVQGARTVQQTSLEEGSSVLPSVVLSLLGYAVAIISSVLVYRRMRFRVAYLITIAPLVALTVITGETLGRLLPSWT